MTKNIKYKMLLKWNGHVKRRDEGHVLRSMLDAPIPGKRQTGRPKTRWKDSCKRGMESVGIRRRTHGTEQTGIMIFNTIPATPDNGKSPGEEEKKFANLVPNLAKQIRNPTSKYFRNFVKE